MSLREEDKPKTGCSSRGLGLAAAAIGVGIGAALYYMFSKEESRETPDTEGATSAQWNVESPQTFRERSWSLEECSICFEVILKNQEVMSLPCTHHFHQSCILPWLQEQQTCPNCRKAVD
nr:probable E3 ubiquitin-protein ligase RHY1A [Maniola hyperantus]